VSGTGGEPEIEVPDWGRLDPALLERIVVLSPHFDDAALGASLLLLHHPGSTVITIMGGRPPAYPDPVSPWDSLGGFHVGDDVVAVRREEDRAAMQVLGAEPVWLDFVDHQYLAPEQRATVADMVSGLEEAILAARPTAVFAPMGLANPDHVVTHKAAMAVRDHHPELGWFCYEDHGYKHLPGLLARRVAKLFTSGRWPTPAIVPIDTDHQAKRKAIWCYTSQIPPLEQDHALSARMEANVPEQFWRIAPPPRGWERLSELG
jgi:LmbE family N-acetylglucosaminyl deacetylase